MPSRFHTFGKHISDPPYAGRFSKLVFKEHIGTKNIFKIAKTESSAKETVILVGISSYILCRIFQHYLNGEKITVFNLLPCKNARWIHSRTQFSKLNSEPGTLSNRQKSYFFPCNSNSELNPRPDGQIFLKLKSNQLVAYFMSLSFIKKVLKSDHFCKKKLAANSTFCPNFDHICPGTLFFW